MARSLLSVALLGVACSSSGDARDLLFEVPLPPAGAVEIISPRFSVPAGSETFTCMQLDVDTTKDVNIQSITGYQADGGHHTLLYYIADSTPVTAEPHECDELDMTGLRFVGTGSGYGFGMDFPAGQVMKIPAGTRVFAQSHYLNATDRDILVQDVVHLHVVPQDEVVAVLGSYANTDLTFAIPPGEDLTRDLACRPPHAINVPWVMPHMHGYGVHKSIKVERANGDEVVVFDGEWDEALRDDFPLIAFDPELELDETDVVHTSCTWRNPEDHVIRFPTEMCATFMVFHPSERGELVACDETGENFLP